MKLHALELVRVTMPLVTPFRTSFGTQHDRRVLLVHAVTDRGDGWGECVTPNAPIYNEEYSDGAEAVIREFLAGPLFPEPDLTAAKVVPLLAGFRGQRMAKAALEAAVLDAQLRASGMPLAEYLGAVRDHVRAGVSLGITGSVEKLLDLVAANLEQGYPRIKLKIEPGWDLAPVAAVRNRFGEDLELQVDANCAYRRGDLAHLPRLDEYRLALIEQPFAADDLAAHADLAARSTTPVCLDESIHSAGDAVRALSVGAASVLNIKAGRVGGYLEARRIHDVAAAFGAPVWCGGMLETGIGRAANVALASLPNFTLPGDISASKRYYATDVTEPFELRNGGLDVPTGPGLGVAVREDALAELGATRTVLRPGG